MLRTALFLTAAFAWNAALAIELDTPVEKKRPTVKSEIVRGKDSAFVCNKIIEDPLKHSLCIDEQIAHSRTSGADTDPYLLGLYFSAWLDMSIRAEVYKTEGHKKAAGRLFSKWNKLEHDLAIDDRTLCAVMEVVTDKVLQRISKER